MNVCFFMPGFITLSKNILTMNPNETRVVKDASGRVKYTVRENGQQEVRRSKRSV